MSFLEIQNLLHQSLQLWFQWVEQWGYVGIFILMAMESSILPVPSEVVIPPAAYWASQGKMDFFAVIVAGTLGSYFGSILSYFLSMVLGWPLLLKYGKYFFLPPKKLEFARHWTAQYGAGGIFFARLLPVIRHLISMPAGMLKMPLKGFSIATIVGAALWCTVLAYAGKLIIGAEPELLRSPEVMMKVFKEKFILMTVLCACFFVTYCVLILFKNKIIKRAKLNDGSRS